MSAWFDGLKFAEARIKGAEDQGLPYVEQAVESLVGHSYGSHDEFDIGIKDYLIHWHTVLVPLQNCRREGLTSGG